MADLSVVVLRGEAKSWIAHPYPLMVSSTGRYLVTQQNRPRLLISDSPQGMLVALSTTDMATYLSTRAAQGFNASQVHIVAGPSFGGGTNYETYDSIHPFTTDGDISTPNNTFFSRLDALLSIAGDYGICVFLNAAECMDALSLWKTNGATKCFNWGAYLGSRYQNVPNICWLVGNDFQTWASDQEGVDRLVDVLNGIQSEDTNHPIFTTWLDFYRSASRDSTDFNAECTLNFGYTYYIAYDLIEEEYALNPTKPVFLGESYYENYAVLGLTGTPAIIRKQNYWSLLAGACGISYHSDNWDFHTGWQDDLILTGAQQIIYLSQLIASSWWLLVPDTSHSVMTAGYGTKASGTTKPDANDYANCARASDGSIIFAFLPTSRQVTIDMTKIAGATARARWFNPSTGAWTTIDTYATSGTQNFTPDAGDWLLVIDAV